MESFSSKVTDIFLKNICELLLLLLQDFVLLFSKCQHEDQVNGQIFLRTKNNLKMMDLLNTKDELTVEVVRGKY